MVGGGEDDRCDNRREKSGKNAGQQSHAEQLVNHGEESQSKNHFLVDSRPDEANE